jgi:L-threonylcarbamoyladenylate synthase
MVLDGGTVERGVESTIVDLTDFAPKIIRERAITSQEIYKVLAGTRLDSNDFQSDSFDF